MTEVLGGAGTRLPAALDGKESAAAPQRQQRATSAGDVVDSQGGGGGGKWRQHGRNAGLVCSRHGHLEEHGGVQARSARAREDKRGRIIGKLA